jgi:hypothetical protein
LKMDREGIPILSVAGSSPAWLAVGRMMDSLNL